MRDRITHILENWFLADPALFQVLCIHDIVENTRMACPVRSGARRLEYNPVWLREMGDDALDQALRTEAVRILLKHPYQRRPEACSQQACAIGSNLVIGDSYHFPNLNIDCPGDFDLQEGQPYEWYSRRIQERLPDSVGSADPDGLSGRAAADNDLSELWDEDELTLGLINGILENTKDWGSLPGSFVEKLKASIRSRINWKTVLAGFRASVLSSERKLTRMRPNRRSGFDAMGSIRRFSTRLLVAVDVSGSISSADLSHFYGVINSAFRYGFTAVDVLQFDTGVRAVRSLKHVIRDVTVIGRGGTSFDEPIEYAHQNGYDGLVILTDGYAPEPMLPDGMRCKIVWVCSNRDSYENCHHWMESSGRVTLMELH